MSQSLSQIYLHFVFSTKNRHEFLKNKQIKQQIYAYISGIIKNQNCDLISIGGISDHVHILLQINRSYSPAKLIAHIKRDSTKWIHNHDPSLNNFGWQNGYGCFSVSHSQINTVICYIQNQEKHHQRLDFKQELVLLCEKHNIKFDEKFLFD